MAGETVKVPGVGNQSKKTVVLVAVGVVVLVGVAYYRHQQAAPAAITDPTVDPATGYAYGSAEDAAALAANQDYQTPPTDPGGGGSPTTQPTPQGYTSNSQWSQAALDALENSTGQHSPQISAALGRYLQGETLDDRQKSYVEQAIAVAGTPPVSGKNGFPPSIRHTASHPAAKTLTPPVVSKENAGKHRATLRWAAVPHATEYTVHGQHHAPRTVKSTRIVVGSGVWYVVARNPRGGYPESRPSDLVTVN